MNFCESLSNDIDNWFRTLVVDGDAMDGDINAIFCQIVVCWLSTKEMDFGLKNSGAAIRQGNCCSKDLLY